MRHRSTVLAAAVIAALTITGCGPFDVAEPTPADWARVAGRDLNCDTDLAVVIGIVDRYDFDRDGTADDFVTMRCVRADRSRTEPGQLEVFKGGTSRDNPTRLGVIVRNREGFLLDGCVGFVGGQAFTRGKKGKTTVVRAAHLEGKDKHVVRSNVAESAAMIDCPRTIRR